VVSALEKISFLRTRSGDLASPSDLHLDTPTNRQCLASPRPIVGGSNELLYRRLRIREQPAAKTLLDLLAASRERSEGPPHPDSIYPALVAAIGRDRGKRANLANVPILWVRSEYRAPNVVLVGTPIPRLIDDAVPVLRRADVLSQAYLDLGAAGHPGDEHCATFFEHISERLSSVEAVSEQDRRLLLEAYRQRGAAGLPNSVEGDVRCLLDRKGKLFSLSDLQGGLLVEGDYPALADALTVAGSDIGIVDLIERSRAFFQSLGIRPLTSIVGAGRPVFGALAPPPFWFKPHHRDLLLAVLHKELFSKALYELAVRHRHGTHGLHTIKLAELQRKVKDIVDIHFLDEISREYTVNREFVRVSVETAVHEGVVGLVKPRTKLDFQQLVAQSLAEVAGAVNVAQARALSTVFLPLVLCRTAEDVRVYVERMGVDVRGWSVDQDDQLDLEEVAAEEVGEEILRQVVQSLDTTKQLPEEAPIGSPAGAASATAEQTPSPLTPPRPAAPPPLTLPDLSDVTMSVAPVSGQQIQSSIAQGGGSRNSSTGWVPRSAAEAERDRDIGRRGEELVYRMELERVRSMGHQTPEDLVVWTSQADPGADHDIRSINEKGQARWLEVKSTSGIDGRFDWPRKEFEKALREGENYELWRVYHAATINPVAKRFPNPGALLGASRIILELGSLRASIEGLE
jgi:Domain of unknown function (DUF3883)